EQYCYLTYKGNTLYTTILFRRGGMCSGFKESYCNLIAYAVDKKNINKKGLYINDRFSFGKHCIINDEGRICIEQKETFSDYPHFVGGNIGHMKNSFYNLKTGELILDDCDTNYFQSTDFVFVKRMGW